MEARLLHHVAKVQHIMCLKPRRAGHRGKAHSLQSTALHREAVHADGAAQGMEDGTDRGKESVLGKCRGRRAHHSLASFCADVSSVHAVAL